MLQLKAIHELLAIEKEPVEGALSFRPYEITNVQ